ncbi:hypothetical protein HN51_008146 [Arachis hypogaea]|uniref:Uncharacterized protein n=2 Tax=Arachis TaxID=3817 RepID=A0A445D4Q9_ARAHY|nr:Extracellular ribonuclease LE [Arachis hypogaea]RYR58179.1 hypothetical protein Ahy_A05g023852 [Arachis hypogaea]
MNSLFIVFHVILLASSVHLTNAASYEYFKLALVWPTTFTRIHASGMTKPKIPQHFTIHGLWPTNFSLPWPANCANNQPKYHFDKSLMTATLQGHLAPDWPSLLPGQSNMDFWTAQWEKHGSCSAERFAQSEYFEKALFHRHNLDIDGELKKVGIIPDRIKTYSRSAIVNAIKKTKTLQVEPELVCFPDNGNALLWEIRVCFDADLVEIIQCPINKSKGVNLCKTKSNSIIIPV